MLAWLSRVRAWIDDTLLAPVWMVLMLPFRRYLVAEYVILGALIVWLVRWMFWWCAVWAVQWWLAPHWLINSRAGLTTAFQVIPAVIVAVFVLVLGSVLVVAQQLVTAYGTRAPMILGQDHDLLRVVARPLVVTIIAVLLAGQVPDGPGAPADGLTAAAATLSLMTILTIRLAAPALPLLFFGYSAPVNFVSKVMDGVGEYLRAGALNMVKFRVTIFEDMMRGGIRRGDTRAIVVGLSGLSEFVDAYLAASKDNPDARKFTYPDGHESIGWLGRDLATALRSAAEDSMGTLIAEDDMDSIGRAMRAFATRFVEAGYHEEVLDLLDAIAWAGTSVQQIQPSGAVNLFVKANGGLALVEATAEEAGNQEIATHALARWAMIMAYANTHFKLTQHPRWEEDIDDMGPNPPWDAAAVLVDSVEYQSFWFNKMPGGAESVIGWLQMSKEQHARQHGYELPPDQKSGIVPGYRPSLFRRLWMRLGASPFPRPS